MKTSRVNSAAKLMVGSCVQMGGVKDGEPQYRVVKPEGHEQLNAVEPDQMWLFKCNIVLYIHSMIIELNLYRLQTII